MYKSESHWEDIASYENSEKLTYRNSLIQQLADLSNKSVEELAISHIGFSVSALESEIARISYFRKTLKNEG